MPDCRISFVIPALDESEHIVRTVTSIAEHAADWVHDLIVVDNGSTDGTGALAAGAGATVLTLADGSVAAARNHGVKHATGTLLVFLDADVSLTLAWRRSFPAACQSLIESPMQVTGSRCLPEPRDDFLTRHWFSRLADIDARYVNTGHMLTSRELFDAIGGFDASRETAEDYDFCRRAAALGAVVANRPELEVIHHDYPRDINAFVRRESWHGTDDFKDLESVMASRIALLACAHLGLLTGASILSIVLRSWLPLLLHSLLAVVAIVALTLYRFGPSGLTRLAGSSVVHALYFAGRTISLLRALTVRASFARSREPRPD